MVCKNFDSNIFEGESVVHKHLSLSLVHILLLLSLIDIFFFISFIFFQVLECVLKIGLGHHIVHSRTGVLFTPVLLPIHHNCYSDFAPTVYHFIPTCLYPKQKKKCFSLCCVWVFFIFYKELFLISMENGVILKSLAQLTLLKYYISGPLIRQKYF